MVRALFVDKDGIMRSVERVVDAQVIIAEGTYDTSKGCRNPPSDIDISRPVPPPHGAMDKAQLVDLIYPPIADSTEAVARLRELERRLYRNKLDQESLPVEEEWLINQVRPVWDSLSDEEKKRLGYGPNASPRQQWYNR
jgi:hypothetical protein